jgi:tRNA-specific 2-thiouridylase
MNEQIIGRRPGGDEGTALEYTSNMARVVLAMSGGVDSSVAAHLLLEQGHDVIGVFMRHGVESPAVTCAAKPQAADSAPLLPIAEPLHHKQGCCTASDAEDARRVADRLGIPFYALNLDAEFGRIIDYFVAEYTAGRTPNPCVQCNNWIKFGKLFAYADSVGAEFVATGHYARIARREASVEEQPASRVVPDPGAPALIRGVDATKDQSYVLFGVRRKLLARMLLPVGGFEKSEIRRLAGQIGLDVAAKRDSQEICFVTRGRYDDFVREYRSGVSAKRENNSEMRASATADLQSEKLANGSGELVLTDGTVVGEHRGIEGYTVGQRKKLGVALGTPKFVVRIERETRRVVLGDREELGRRELVAADCNWLVDEAALPARCLVQIRYNAPPAAAAVRWDGARLHVAFDEPQYGVAPGQAAVCYDGERVLGGGWIA